MDFERAMTNDAALKSAIDSHDLAKEISLGFLEEEVRDTINDFEATTPQVDESFKSKNNSLWYWWVAAVIMLAGIAYYLFGMNHSAINNTSQEVFASIYEEPAWHGRDRGSEDDSLAEAIHIATNINLIQGVQQLKKLSIIKAEKDYWLAELFTKFDQPDSVMHYLPQDYKDNVRRDRVLYLQILAQYKFGNTIRVKRLIDELPGDTDKWYIERYELLK